MKISLVTATNIVVIGYAFNNVLPARLGEFVRSVVMSERACNPYSQALMRLSVIERVLDGLAIVFLLSVTAPQSMPPTADWIHPLIRDGLILFVASLIGVLFLGVAPNFLVNAASRVTSRRRRAHDLLVGMLSQITRGSRDLQAPA